MYFTETENQHPLMTASNALLHAAANFASHLGDDLRATIDAAAVEADLVNAEVARLKDQLNGLRARCVVDGVPRSSLTACRKALADAETRQADLSVGLDEAERLEAAGAPEAAAINELTAHVRRLATVIRDGRAAAMSAMEYDRVCPAATFQTVEANAGALEEDLVTLERMVGSPVPTPIANAATALRKAVTSALQDVRVVQHRQTGIGRRAA